MSSVFDEWVAKNDGAFRDIDGYYGAQCWDLFAAYCIECMNAPRSAVNTASFGADAGYAGSLWSSFPTSQWMQANFDKVNGNALVGDVAIWGRDATHPLSHVAIVVANQTGSNIRVIAQNAGTTQNARIMWDTPASYGYLRPKDRSFITGETMKAEDVWTYNWNNRMYGGNTFNALGIAAEYAVKATRLNQPAVLGAKDTDKLYWMAPGRDIIPMLNPDELNEMKTDYKNIFGVDSLNVKFNSEKQLNKFIKIYNRKP